MTVNTTVVGMAVVAIGVLCGYEANIFSTHRQNSLNDDQPQIRDGSSKDRRGREPDAKDKRVSKQEYAVPRTAPQFDGLHCFETLVMH